MKNLSNLDSLLAPIKASLYEQQQRSGRESAAAPFITISRQAGAGGRSLAERLVQRLNEMDDSERPWSAWDRELVERIAAEHGIPQELIDSLESPGPSWLEQLFSLRTYRVGLADLNEFQIYRRAVGTIRALARAGRAVIVGLGGMYATEELLNGIHVRLVAPLEFRIKHLASTKNLPPVKAAEEVNRVQQNREAFYKRFWPDRPLAPESFTITLNAARIDEEAQVQCILPLITTAMQEPAGRTEAAYAGAAV